MERRERSEKLNRSVEGSSAQSHYRQFSANKLSNRRLLSGNPLQCMGGPRDGDIFQEVRHV